MDEQDTYTVDIEVRLRKKIQSPGEVLLDLGPDGHIISPGVPLLPIGMGKIRGDNVRSPGVIFFPLDVDKIRGDPGLDNRPVSPMAGPIERPRAEDILGGRNELEDPVGGASRGGRIDVPRIPVLFAALRQLHHQRHVLRCHRHCSGTLVPSPRRLWDAVSSTTGAVGTDATTVAPSTPALGAGVFSSSWLAGCS